MLKSLRVQQREATAVKHLEKAYNLAPIWQNQNTVVEKDLVKNLKQWMVSQCRTNLARKNTRVTSRPF